LNTSIPQLAEKKTTRAQDASGNYWFYYKCMTRVYVAGALTGEHPALRVMLPDLNWKVAGEAVDRATTLAQTHPSLMDILSTDRDVLSRISPTTALHEHRRDCQAARVIGFISHLDVCRQAVIASGTDAFIGKVEIPERVRSAATGVHFKWCRLAE
jgi:hypothetical protein